MVADPRRRARSYRTAIALASIAALIYSQACADPCPDASQESGGVCVETSEARLIDRLCRAPLTGGPACEASDGAAKTTGLTDDSTGFMFGATGGAATFHIQALTGIASSNFDIEVLVAATDPASTALTSELHWGSCGPSCSPDPPPLSIEIPADYRWVRVVLNEPGAGAKLGYDAVLTLTGKNLEIGDMRVTGRNPTFNGHGCSIARPIGAR